VMPVIAYMLASLVEAPSLAPARLLP
jgi:hypothetical protein